MSKDFKNNPALNFLNTEQGKETQSKEKAPEGMRLNPEYIEKYIEKRTKRVQIIMQPSLYDKAKAKAESRGTSFNDYVHSLIEADNK
jgi:hypothetical protein